MMADWICCDEMPLSFHKTRAPGNHILRLQLPKASVLVGRLRPGGKHDKECSMMHNNTGPRGLGGAKDCLIWRSLFHFSPDKSQEKHSGGQELLML